MLNYGVTEFGAVVDVLCILICRVMTVDHDNFIKAICVQRQTHHRVS